MKIFHQICNNWEESQMLKLKEFNIKVNTGFDCFNIEENNNYFEVQEYLKKWNATDFIGTEFTKSEKINSNFAQLYASWLNDYPQPEDDYLEASYDLTNYCSECGIGKKQNAPLRIKKEPKWSGRKKVFGLNWIFDVLFIQKEWYEQVFKPLGLESQPVILHKKNIPTENVVQLIIPEIKTNLNLADYPTENCSKCGRIKYLPITKGFFPSLKEEVEYPIFKSLEYVGSGASASKWIIINKELKDKLMAQKFNIDLHPLE